VVVGGAEAGVVSGLGQGLGQSVVVEGTGVGESLAVVDDHPYPHAGGGCRRERLDFAVEHFDLGVVGPPDVGLHLLAGSGVLDDPRSQRQQVAVVLADCHGGRLAGRDRLRPRCRRR